MNLQQAIAKIKPLDTAAMAAAQARWNSIAKPLHSLGLLEDVIIKIAGITGSATPDISKKAVLIFCADNGVVASGVTQTGSEVTAIVTQNFAKGMTSVNHMATLAGADVFPVDVGVLTTLTHPGIIQQKIAYGTQDITKGPAMTMLQAIKAIEAGIEQVSILKQKGYTLIATGEMGIGNTTTAAAVTAALLGQPAAAVTGRGAGLSTGGLQRKIAAVQAALAVNSPNPKDALDVLHKLGGLDIAALAGAFIAGAALGVPVLIDGVISAAGALVAMHICPEVQPYLLGTHISKEPAGALLTKALGVYPFLDCAMCLGEGTGAVAAMPLIDMGHKVYTAMGTFGDIQVETYTEQL